MVCGWRRTEREPLPLPFPRDALIIVSFARCASVSWDLIDITANLLLVADHARLDRSTRSLRLVVRRGHLHTSPAGPAGRGDIGIIYKDAPFTTIARETSM